MAHFEKNVKTSVEKRILFGYKYKHQMSEQMKNRTNEQDEQKSL